MAKKLFLLVSDNGDGSYSIGKTLNADWIGRQQERYGNSELEHGDLGVDGDGFHYSTVNVPDDATLESLGILWDCADTDD